jgi:catechol 2,3-dioxygenase-like lactoylglutathione lyase family enzyme
MLTGARLSHLLVYVHNIDMSTEFYHRQLGLPLIEQTNSWAKLDAGQIVIHLQRAVDHDVTLYGRRDDSSDIVFLVEDLERMREALAGRGIHFERRRSYEVGLVTDFYDPNGHRLMLYQPSETAMTWPSADKIREVWRACGRGGADVIGPSAGPALGSDAETGLAGNPLIYLFMFENDQTRAYEFYRDALRLTSLERVHCCNQDCDAEIEGIVKYDGGGVLLSTHHMHEKSMVFDDLGQPYSPKKFTPAHGQGIAPVFQVDDVEGMMAALSARGVRFERGLEQDVDGEYARFEDPFGHPFFIHRPRTRVGATA